MSLLERIAYGEGMRAPRASGDEPQELNQLCSLRERG